MMDSHSFEFLVADIGNTAVHVGRFSSPLASKPGIPRPVQTWKIPHRDAPAISVAAEQRTSPWFVASVSRPGLEKLVRALKSKPVPPLPVGEGSGVRDDRQEDRQPSLTHSGSDSSLTRRVTVLGAADFPIENRLARPEQVGTDRLAAAVAANRLRATGQPAIIIDAGTAITVDVVSESGAYVGGAILPGLAMAARALAEQTDALPLIDFDPSDPPPPIGDDTISAMQSGLFWGTSGAIKKLIDEIIAKLTAPPLLLATGGDSTRLLYEAGVAATYEPDLTLAGIAIAAAATIAPAL